MKEQPYKYGLTKIINTIKNIVRKKRFRLKARKRGYDVGCQEGYEAGLRESNVREVPQNYFWDKRVLYVAPIHGGTYKVINQGIIDAHRNLVREVYTAGTEQNVASIAAEFRPDLVLVLLGDTLPFDQVNAIRAMGIKTAVWFTDDPYYSDVTLSIAPHYDYVFTQELSCVSLYPLLGCQQVHYLPLAVNTRIFHFQREDRVFNTDVCFLGTAWNNRILFFDQIAPYLATKNVLIVGPYWNRLNHYALLSDKIRLEVLSPEESAFHINKSKIVINNHRPFNDETVFNKNSRKLLAHSINPRTFEISACGAFQLTDYRQNLNRFYKVGKEIETYSSHLELIEKIEYYLSHEEERNTIALRGLSRTLKENTYPRRITELLKVVFG